MAQSPAPAGAVPAGAPVPARTQADDLTPMLLEYQSPSSALIEQSVPARSRYTLWVLASMFVVGLVLAGTVPIDRVVVSQGKVVTTNSNIAIQPLETSIVRSIDVREGQIVKAGQLLARLDPTFAAADADALETQVASLQAEVDRLQAEVEGRSYVGDGTAPSQLQTLIFTQRAAERSYRQENFRQRIDAVRVRVAQAMADVESYTVRLGVARQVEAMRVELERQAVGSRLNTFQALQDRNESARLLDAARSQAVGSQRELDALIAERDSYVQQTRNESSQQLTEQGRKLNEARENLNKARLRRELVEIRADRDSIVLSVAPVSVGSVMQSAEQFLTLVPLDAPLEIEAVVDGRDAGFVGVGDPVTIKFDTFPYAIYGTADGRVQVVSPDSFRNPNEDRQRQRGPRGNQDFGAAYYRAKMSIDALKLHNLPEGFRLSPGMPVTADIKIGKRTVLAYLFSRIVPVAKEGLREP
jgi:HlyD family secretion protein